jgi:hypothetical protein
VSFALGTVGTLGSRPLGSAITLATRRTITVTAGAAVTFRSIASRRTIPPLATIAPRGALTAFAPRQLLRDSLERSVALDQIEQAGLLRLPLCGGDGQDRDPVELDLGIGL